LLRNQQAHHPRPADLRDRRRRALLRGQHAWRRPENSSEALGNATLPFGLALADKGLDALKANVHLARGLNVLKGELTHPAVAEALGKTSVDPYGVWK